MQKTTRKAKKDTKQNNETDIIEDSTITTQAKEKISTKSKNYYTT